MIPLPAPATGCPAAPIDAPAPAPLFPPESQAVLQTRPIAWDNVRRVLAVRQDNRGDVLLCGPALRAIKEARPQVHLTLWTSPAGAEVWPLLPWVDAVLVSRPLWQDVTGRLPFDPARERRLIARLRRGGYDVAIIFTSFAQSPFPPAYAAYLAGIPVRIGQSKEFGGGVLSHPVPPPPDALHQAERNLRLVEAVGLPVGDRQLALSLPPAARRRAARLLRRAGVTGSYLLVTPGASCPARRYPLDRLLQALALVLAAWPGWAVLGGDRAEAERLAAAGPLPPRTVSLAGQTDLPTLAALVAGAALVLTPNTLAMHLADASRVPVVVLFAGTELECQWRPRATRHRLLRRETPCSPCYRFDCPYGLACLDLPPAGVARAVLELLAAAGTAPALQPGRER